MKSRLERYKTMEKSQNKINLMNAKHNETARAKLKSKHVNNAPLNRSTEN